MPKYVNDAAAYGPPTKTNRKIPKGKPHLRSNRTSRLLNLYTSKVVRDKKSGQIVRGSVLSMDERIAKGQMARIAPDRRWFGNTRTISPKVLDKFREEMKAKFHDPYSIVLRAQKLPTTLLIDKDNDAGALPKNAIDFTSTFGKLARRKRPKTAAYDYETLRKRAETTQEKYVSAKDKQTVQAQEEAAAAPRDLVEGVGIFQAGQSSRLWKELYKVIDSSDVLIQVLDARDPMGTRSKAIENYLKKEKRFKHLIFVLNKIDLIPTWATSRWVSVLSREYPTIAFHASITHPFGKGNLISLIRQFGHLQRTMKPGECLSVGLIGYPNVGKSSVINTLRHKKVCSVAPIPGETKVWQYVAITKGIYLIDCPGVIHQNDEANDHAQAVLKGVVRVERITREDKTDFVEPVLKLVRKKDIVATYNIKDWTDHLDFLRQLAEQRHYLDKGGVPNLNTAATLVLYDWQRAKLPWFVAPPFESDAHKAAHVKLPKADHVRQITETHNATVDQAREAAQLSGIPLDLTETKTEFGEKKRVMPEDFRDELDKLEDGDGDGEAEDGQMPDYRRGGGGGGDEPSFEELLLMDLGEEGAKGNEDEAASASVTSRPAKRQGKKKQAEGVKRKKGSEAPAAAEPTPAPKSTATAAAAAVPAEAPKQKTTTTTKAAAKAPAVVVETVSVPKPKLAKKSSSGAPKAKRKRHASADEFVA